MSFTDKEKILNTQPIKKEKKRTHLNLVKFVQYYSNSKAKLELRLIVERIKQIGAYYFQYSP